MCYIYIYICANVMFRLVHFELMCILVFCAQDS